MLNAQLLLMLITTHHMLNYEYLPRPESCMFLKAYSRWKCDEVIKYRAPMFSSFLQCFCWIFAIIAIKHDCHSLTFARSLGKGWKHWAMPLVFNTSLGTLGMLMKEKSCLISLISHCFINSYGMSQKTAHSMLTCTCNVKHPTFIL